MAEINWGALAAQDWEQLARLAQREGVAPLLYAACRGGAMQAAIPPTALTSLAGSFYASAAQNLLLSRELREISAALQAGDVPFIVLKGAALAPDLYPDLALRPMTDLDLLVRRERLQMAQELLQPLGYLEFDRPELAGGLAQRIGYHLRLFKPGGAQPVVVELHWNLIGGDADWRTPPTDWFWSQAVPLDGPAAGAPALACKLNPQAHLLYMAAHLMLKHGGGEARLLWFYDLYLLVQRYQDEIDWNELLRQARRFHWTAAVRTALARAQRCFGLRLPEQVLAPTLAAEELAAADLVARKQTAYPTMTAKVWRDLLSLDWPTRLRLVAAYLLPSPQFMRYRYPEVPPRMWLLAYPLRWGQILGDAFRTLRARLSGGRGRSA
jgi:hypothetical protein